MRESKQPTEATLEVRYRPNPIVLDHRGEWAEDLAAHLGLSEWQIVENRLDVFSTDRQDHAFVSYRNAGMVIQNPPTGNYAGDKSVRLLRRLLSYSGFGDPLFVERIGFRLRQAVPMDASFEDLVAQLATGYVRMSPELESAVADGRLVDLASPLNFSDRVGRFNTNVGPMRREEFKQHFRRHESLPETGFYVDIDYWEQPKRSMPGAELVGRVSSFVQAAHRRLDELRAVAIAPANVEA